MAHKILPRSAWSSTSARGTGITWSRVRGIVCHYPAMGKAVGVLTQAQEAARLRGWRSYHVNSLGWLDIGYSYAIGQSGRIYSLRGDRVGGHTYGHNSTTLGVLFIVGDNEPLTAAAKAAFRALRATLRKRGASSGVWGHREMSGNSTRCPGPFIMGSIRDGSLTGSSAGASKPSTPSKPSPSPSAEFADVDKTQTWLKALGYDPGPLDGKYDTKTAAATRAAQEALGITPVDGRPGPTTRTHLEAAVTTLDKISKDLATIKRALEPGIAGKRTDGEHVAQMRKFRNELSTTIPAEVLDAPIRLQGSRAGTTSTLRTKMAWLDHERDRQNAAIAGLSTQLAGLSAAVTALADGGSVDLEAVRAAAAEGARQGGVSVSAEDVAALLAITVAPDDEG
ncbi:peptidoglycan-binding protein [Brachybacterium massiliense]|uniref:peptidoglycan-binding protein n=1 Tax=Brachybacterium massiliense TaxID=1755098 RepID=UPI000B3BB19A|nr:peptidoglycan-binding protein [Brachybacterium massiliense]